MSSAAAHAPPAAEQATGNTCAAVCKGRQQHLQPLLVGDGSSVHMAAVQSHIELNLASLPMCASSKSSSRRCSAPRPKSV
jgi:hypothetical protein